jgi:phenylpyruvate tautomerase PptA (4-oxalocrotonate tautomerase family)
MPFARILLQNTDATAAEMRAIADAVQRAFVVSLAVPEGDRFQVVSSDGAVIVDREYLGMDRSENMVVIQITMALGRTVEQKKALFRALADNLATLGVRGDDIFSTIIEVPRENFSFGRGIAQYASAAPPHLAGAEV